MRKKLYVEVTEDHFRRGVAGNRERCPVALAVGEALKKATGTAWEKVSVGYSGIYLSWDSQAMSCPAELPTMACVLASRYDEGLPVSPIKFEMEYGQGI